MRITVFGANGKLGRLVVDEALRRGHLVTAFIHHKSSLSEHVSLRLIKGDVYIPTDVLKAVRGSDAVISALGSWGTPKKDVLSAGMQNIVPAMKASGINRIISVTGGAANAPNDKLSFADKLSHKLLELFAAKILNDGEEHINLLNESGLNYTVIRSGIMTEAGKSNTYKLADKRPLPWATINRNLVANAMLDLIESNQYKKQSPFITHS